MLFKFNVQDGSAELPRRGRIAPSPLVWERAVSLGERSEARETG
jgi:hypothetical protein